MSGRSHWQLSRGHFAAF
nr:unnamed protein product [Callosobruchus analis]